MLYNKLKIYVIWEKMTCIIVNFFVVGTVLQFAIKNQVTLVTCILLQIFSNCVFWFYKGSKISKYIFFLVASSNKKNQWKQKLSSFSVVVFEFWHTPLKRSIFQTFWKPDSCPDFFVFWVWDFKFWIFVYFLMLLNCAKFEPDWTNLISNIL